LLQLQVRQNPDASRPRVLMPLEGEVDFLNAVTLRSFSEGRLRSGSCSAEQNAVLTFHVFLHFTTTKSNFTFLRLLSYDCSLGARTNNKEEDSMRIIAGLGAFALLRVTIAAQGVVHTQPAPATID